MIVRTVCIRISSLAMNFVAKNIYQCFGDENLLLKRRSVYGRSIADPDPYADIFCYIH